jgi:REP-associated tyrosine transposase
VAHTYVSDLVHCVSSTKARRKVIPVDSQEALWGFIGGIARKNGFKTLIVGGTDDHVHILLSLPATMPLAKAVQLLKGPSSRWMNETHTKGFSWQEGYGASTLGVSQKPGTIDYIKRQAEHHQKCSVEQEFLVFLKKHAIDSDPKYVWG